MILLRKGQENELIVTLREKGSLTNGYWRFLFTHEATRQEVEVVLNMSEDTSSFPLKYNQFPLTVDDHFTAKNTGLWTYQVYEQDEEDDPLIQNLVEVGIMKLLPAAEFEIPQFEGEDTEIKTFNGQ